MQMVHTETRKRTPAPMTSIFFTRGRGKTSIEMGCTCVFLSVLRQRLSFYTLDVCSTSLTLLFFFAPYRFTGVRTFLDNCAHQLSWWLQRLSSSDSRAASSFHAFRLRLLASICLVSLRSSTAIMCSNVESKTCSNVKDKYAVHGRETSKGKLG